MTDDENIENYFLDYGFPKRLVSTLKLESDDTIQKKKKKYRINNDDELEEKDEYYTIYYNEILRYPPDSNPPTSEKNSLPYQKIDTTYPF